MAQCERRKSQILNFIGKGIVRAVAALEGASTSASYQDVLVCFGLRLGCDNKSLSPFLSFAQEFATLPAAFPAFLLDLPAAASWRCRQALGVGSVW